MSCRGATFLGVDLAPGTMHHVIDTGGVVFPDLPGLPFDAYRSRLYTSEELLAGWDPDVAGSFAESLDMRIYRWASRAPTGTSPSILDALRGASTTTPSTTRSRSICGPTPTWSR